jgi:formylglycine-generating enzyme required for sulfatase activity
MKLDMINCLTAIILITGCNHATVRNDQRKIISSTNLIGMEFVQIPPGTFRMGSQKSVFSSPVHSVTLSSFEIMCTEVTNSQYEAFEKRTRAPESSLDNGPVCGVKRKDVVRFLKWLSQRDEYTYQVPTEAQWEYAARGGLEGKDFPWGDTVDDSKALIEGPTAVAVKTYPPNGFGLFEMCGNVAEMCWGPPFHYSAGTKTDPRGEFAMDYYASRGSGIKRPLAPWIWLANIESDDPEQLPGLGFRLVRWKDSNPPFGL